MNKFILPLLLLVGYSNAQTNFNVAYHSKNESTSQYGCLVELFNEFYFPSINYEFDNFGRLNLYKVTTQGQFVFKKTSPVKFEPKRLIKTLDNKVLYVGYQQQCDVVSPPHSNYIMKMDTSGAITFTNVFQENYPDPVKDVVQYSDSSYYAFSDSILYHYSKTGQFLMRKNTGLKNISSAIMDNGGGGIYLSAKKNSANAICVMDNTGAVTSTVSSSLLFTKMEFYGSSQLIGLATDGKLYKYSNGFVPLGVSNFSFTVNVGDFVVKSDSLYCISNATAQTYFVSDTAFNVINSSNLASGGMEQKSIVRYQNSSCVLMDARSKSTSAWMEDHRYITVNVFGKLSSNSMAADVEVMSIKVDSIYATYSIPTGTPAPPPSHNVFIRAKVMVKNKSIVPMNSFKLNFFYYPGVACGSHYYQGTFTTNALPQGDSVEVLTPFLNKLTYTTSIPAVINQPFCIFATVPNDQADKYYQDNELCQTFTVLTDVSVKENSTQEILANIFPNPFDTKMSIESNSLIKTIELYDQLGRIVFEKEIEAKRTDLELQNISSGVYFLRIYSEKNSQTKKVIKH